MWPLFKQIWRHVFRTKLLLVLLLLTVGLQWLALSISAHGKFHVNEELVMTWHPRESLLVALFVQLFLGTFLSAIYGIWVLPYLHQGNRTFLTFTLPLAKWKYPLCYMLTLFTLLVVMHVAMVASYALVFGPSGLWSVEFPWRMIGYSLLLETVAFMVVTFGFALSSMAFGAISTFFLGALAISLLQGAAILLHVNQAAAAAEFRSASLDRLDAVYNKLPMGELPFQLWAHYKDQPWSWGALTPWVVWMVLFGVLFYLRLQFPPRHRMVTDS